MTDGVMVKKRVVFVSQSMAHPRIARRANMFQSLGYEVCVYSFMREGRSTAKYSPGVELVSLGVVLDGLGIKRMFQMVGAIIKIFMREVFLKQDYVVGFMLDSAGIAQVSMPWAKVVYEISDLRFTSKDRSVVSSALCSVEDVVMSRCCLIIVTSPYFLHELAQRVPCLLSRHIVLENVLPLNVVPMFKRRLRKVVKNRRIRIGFVGAIRYFSQLEKFLEVVGGRVGEFEFHMYGDSIDLPRVMSYVEKYSNVYYHGKYSNPEDLGSVYGALDLTYSVYDDRDYNVRVALPNKLYESVYFGVPIIAAYGTMLASRINEWGVGGAVSPSSCCSIGNFLDGINSSVLQAWFDNTMLVSLSELTESTCLLKRKLELPQSSADKENYIL